VAQLQDRFATPIVARVLYGGITVLLDSMDGAVVAFVIGVNTALGLLFGYLFWRHGLESR
jgi:O-antigen/teichoic acid export membrane protein